jgi:putative colanic acid biosynthesis UDP-glucose lipid carrier transferase
VTHYLFQRIGIKAMRRTAVIVGAGETGSALAERLQAVQSPAIRIAGFFDDRRDDRLKETRRETILGSFGDLGDYVRSRRADLVYITLPMTSRERVLSLLDQISDTTASIYFVPDVLLLDAIQARIGHVGGMAVLAVCESPFRGVNGLVKRASDIVVASAILALSLPVMIAIAVGVKLSSPGPTLFKQHRYGLDGRPIVVYKFRTMIVTEDGESIRQATRGDTRVTRFGALLRRTSLDELPQFINVLQGRMSVVGPRPHAVAHNELYRKLIRGYMIRHKVKPGITGWAQINGLRGETDTLEKMRARIEHDLTYLRNWSLALDLQIVLKTIFVLGKPNAY